LWRLRHQDGFDIIVSSRFRFTTPENVTSAANRVSMSFFRKIPYVKPLTITFGVLLAYALIGFVGVPRLIERAVPDYVAEHLQRKATIGTVRFHPFIFTLDVRDFALTENDGTPIAGFRRLLVDFELSSIWRWAWTFSRIGVEGLNVNVDIRPDGKLNFELLAESLAKDSPPSDTGKKSDDGPPRLVFQHISLSEAAVTISDRSDATPASATFKPINLELRDISTLPNQNGPHKVQAQIPGGGILSWNGRNLLHPIASEGEIRLTGARLELPWRFLRDETNLIEPEGTIDIGARYRFSYTGDVVELVVEDLRLTAKGIGLARPGDPAPILSLQAIDASGGRFELGTRELILPEVAVRGGSVVVALDERGGLNWQQIVRARQPTAESKTPANPDVRPWKVRLDAVRVADVALDYVDQNRAIPIAIESRGVQVGVAAQLEVGGAETQAVVRDLSITMSGIKWGEPGAKEPLAAIEELAVAGGELNLLATRAAVKSVTVKGGQINVTRNADGRIRIVDVAAAAKTTKARRELDLALKQADAKGRVWAFSLDTFEVDGTRVAFRDEGFASAISYDVESVEAVLSNIKSDGKTPIRFDAKLKIAQGGVARAKGEIGGLGQRVDANVNVERLDLKPLQPLVAAFSATRLESGLFSTAVKIALRTGKDSPDLQVAGGLEIGGLLLNESGSGERLIAWKSLATKGIDFKLKPLKLAVREVRLTEPGAKVVIFKDRSLNLAKALSPPVGKEDENSARVAPKATAAPAPSSPPPSAPAPDISVESIVVEKGEVDFADLSLVLPFAAKVEDLRGSFAGISSDPARRTGVKLAGRVGKSGQAQVNGSVRPFAPKAFTDLGVTFRNVSMPPLSPYSVTFAGRKIASGELTLDLRYKIGNSKLAGDSKILLERFTLGKRVKAPGAVDLPLDLAVALLTDANGKINIAVPVSGSVDDPQFSYGHVVGQALATVIQNIVTAPFRALGGLVGGGGENLDSVGFEPGAQALLPAERDKLKRIADVLGKRPRLKLLVEGQYGEKDRAVLRQREVTATVASRLGRPVARDEPLPPVNPADAKTQRILEALFAERQSAQALAQFASAFGSARGKPVQRVDPLLAAVGKPSADVAFYEALLQQLIESAPVSDEVLLKLADDRARAVADQLVQGLSVPATRVARKPAAGKGAAQVKLFLDVAAGGAG